MLLTLADRAFLAEVPLFSAFDRAELATISNYLEAREAEPGQVIIWSDSDHRSLFVLAKGQVVVTIQVRGEVESVLAHLGPGAHFGELTFIDGQPAAGSVTAESACRLLVIPIDRMRALRDEQSPLFGKLAWAMLKDLAQKLRHTNEKVLDAVLWGLDAAQIDPAG
ncbi:cyclic nucleotide-binding domain-containing protein [Myxococcota bacterium]|nr:cyclic nucleotide-binding domain-containing protein [Myxococcota bacterium]